MPYFTENFNIYKLYHTLVVEDVDNNMMSASLFKDFETTLVAAKARLYEVAPFYANILYRMHTVPTTEVNTMAVDAAGNIYINPMFMLNDLTFDETVAVLAHEANHIANLTFFRKGSRDHTKWNIATDYIMNRDLCEDGLKLPVLGLLADQDGNKRWVVRELHGTSLKNVDITDLTAEQLYAIIEQDASNQDDEKKQSKSGEEAKSKQETSKGKSSHGGVDEHIEEGAKKPTPMETPSNDPTYKPAEKNKEQIQGEVASASQQTRSEGRGSEPRSLKDSKKSTVNWKNILNQFVMAMSDATRYNEERVSRMGHAIGAHLPKREKIKDKLNAVIAIDTSGSMSDELIGQIVNHITRLSQQYPEADLNLLFWHTEVYMSVNLTSTSPQKVVAKLNEIQRHSKIQAGGTTLSCIKQYLDAQKIKAIDGLIVFTDGYVEDAPMLPKADQKVFCIVGGGTTDIVKKLGGKVYEI